MTHHLSPTDADVVASASASGTASAVLQVSENGRGSRTPGESTPPGPQSISVYSHLEIMHSFFTDESLCRAISVWRLLAGFGSILQSSEGSEATYNLSQPVKNSRWFISHNWSTPRFSKFAVLAFSFNFWPAVLLTALSHCLIIVLTAMGYLPLLECCGGERRIGVVAQCIGPFFFLTVLFTWHEVGSRIGLLGTKVFIDKACIHQSDDSRRVRGIQKLAAFLQVTDGMLVVYSQSFLQRLWTVFELASLLIMFPEKNLVVVPIFFPTFVVVGSLMVYLGYLSYMFALLESTEELLGVWRAYLAMAAIAGGAFTLCTLLRRWARREEDIHKAVEAFHLSEAACTQEADRNRICNTVEHWLKSRGHTPWDTSQEDTLQAFDEMVHRKVPRALISTFGRTGVPYHIVTTMLLAQHARLVDALGGYLHDGAETSLIVIRTVEYLTVGCAIIPTFLALMSRGMRTCRSFRGVSEVLFVILFSGLSMLATGVMSWYAFFRLSQWARESLTGLFCFALAIIFFTATTVYLYGPLSHDKGMAYVPPCIVRRPSGGTSRTGAAGGRV